MCRRGTCLRAAACAHERQRGGPAPLRSSGTAAKVSQKNPPRGAETPPPLRGSLWKRPCVGARCREYCFGPLPRAPERPGPAGLFRGRKVVGNYESRHLEFTISGGRLFSKKEEASVRPARCPLSSRSGGTWRWCRSPPPLRQHPLPPERRPGPLQRNHISTQRPCSSPWPRKVFIAEAESFADRCTEAFDA